MQQLIKDLLCLLPSSLCQLGNEGPVSTKRSCEGNFTDSHSKASLSSQLLPKMRSGSFDLPKVLSQPPGPSISPAGLAQGFPALRQSVQHPNLVWEGITENGDEEHPPPLSSSAGSLWQQLAVTHLLCGTTKVLPGLARAKISLLVPFFPWKICLCWFFQGSHF